MLAFPDATPRAQRELKSALAALAVNSPPRSKVITAKDYLIKPILEQKNGYLYLSGRIEGGPYCDRLTLTVSCISEENRHATIIDVAENLGGIMSDLLESKTHVYGGSNKTRWDVTGIQGRCQD